MAERTPTRALDQLAAFDDRWSGSDTGRRRDHQRRRSVATDFALALIVPGAGTMRRFVVLGIVLLLVGIVVPLAVVVWAATRIDDAVSLALDPRFLRAVVVAAVAAVLARVVAVLEVAISRRRERSTGPLTAVAVLLLVAACVPVGWGVVRADEARRVVEDVFAGGGSSTPVFERPDAPVVAGTRNILLLGGDEGPGRWGLRTDSIIVVSVDEASGRTALISVPRNLERLQFPPGSPLAERYPDGFDDLANAVYPRVFTQPDLQAAYARDGLQPEALAVAEGIGYSLGVHIDDYVLVNMEGFADLVDALGGITVELNRSLPLPPSPTGEPLPASIGPGAVEMDGTLALAFARSRSADSDYQRMERQRLLLSALADQISVRDAVEQFSSIASALSDTLRTSLTTSEFTDLIDTLDDAGVVTESIGLVPPLITPSRPDFEQIRAIVDEVQRALATGEPADVEFDDETGSEG